MPVSLQHLQCKNLDLSASQSAAAQLANCQNKTFLVLVTEFGGGGRKDGLTCK